MVKQQGQSLVEMIVIVGVIVLLATGIIAGTTASLSRSETSRVRSEALSHAQAGIELARGLRDDGWAAFAAMNSSESYCVGSDGNFGVHQPSCTAFNIENTYIRSVKLELTDSDTMNVTSKVVWGDTTNPLNTVHLTTYFTDWKLQ